MTQKKETKTKITVRDLEPKKDAKGGVAVDVSTKTHNENRNTNRNVNNRNVDCRI